MALPSSGPLSLDDIGDYIEASSAPYTFSSNQSLNHLAVSANVGNSVSSFYGYNPSDAQIYLAAVRAAYYPSIIGSSEQYALENLFSDLVTYGLYSKITAFYPLMGTTAGSQRLNAKVIGGVRQSAYDIYFSGGWTFGPEGIYGNGGNSFWTVDYAYNDTTILDSHFGVYQSLIGSSNYGFDIAVYDGSLYSPVFMTNNYNGYQGIYDYNYSDGFNTYSIVNDPASSMMSYDSVHGTVILYQNSQYVTDYVVGPEAMPTPAYVGGGYDYFNGTFTDKTFGFITFGQSLTGTEMRDYQDIINNFMYYMNRNIY